MWFLIEHAKLLISVDTGIAHLAKLAGTPIVTLFGPGSPVSHGVGNFWKFLDHADITKSDLNCRNQPVLFRRKIEWLKRCGRNSNQCKTPGACMDAITPAQVMNFIDKNIYS
jgi:ADP-heptose:LPS heptosyltransferase